jgi:hypothetical protein
MGYKPLRFRKAPTVIFGVTSLLCLGAPLQARTTLVPNKPAQTEDASRRQIDEFNRFLEDHRDIAVELHSKPWLVRNDDYLQRHPDLRSYVDEHPGLREAIDQDPVAFMREDAQRSELAQFSRFLDTHRQIAEDLRKDPSSADNYAYRQSHPDLKAYLDQHDSVKQALHENAAQFLKEEEGFDRSAGREGRDIDARGGNFDRDRDANNRDRDRDADARNRDADNRDHDPGADARDRDADNRDHDPGADARGRDADNRDRDPGADARNRDADNRDRDPGADARNRDADNRDHDRGTDAHDRDANRGDLAEFDRFLDSHREIGEQIRKDPSLANNREFVQNHPALGTFLQNNPGVRDDLRRDPNTFMHQETGFDRAENAGNRDPMHDHMAAFGGFLGDHRDIARDLYKDPSKVKNREFVQNRPDLDTYLTAHPDVRNDLMANPKDFVKGAQQMSNGSTNGSGTTGSGSGSGSGTSAGTTGSKTPSGSSGPSTSSTAPTPKPKQ